MNILFITLHVGVCEYLKATVIEKKIHQKHYLIKIIIGVLAKNGV